MEMSRIILGFIVAAFWLPLLLSFSEYGEFWFRMVLLFTAPIIIIFGVPLFILFYSKRNISFMLCAISGIALGLVGCVLFLLLSNTLTAYNVAPLFTLSGLLSGIIFWFVGVWKNDTLTRRSS